MLEADVLTLGMAADEARRTVLGTSTVTYLRVHDVSTAGEIPAAAGEVRLYGLPETFEAAEGQLRATKALGGGRRVVAYSWADLEQRGWATRDHLRRLLNAGLDDLAELPVDSVHDLEGALDALTGSGLSPQRLTVANPIPGDRAALLRRVEAAFERYPSLRRFSPLPRVAPVDKPTTGYDDVRMVALARLALQTRSIEVDWQLYGPKLAQVALTFGADHLDAVSASDDTTQGRRRGTIEDVERNIKAAGFEPQEYRPAR
jgi:hypothetical protein